MLLSPALAISAVLFTLGVAGVLFRRNAIVIFMCVELMLNAVNLTFVALAQNLGVGGQVFVFFVMAVAAAEAAVGLAIILAVYRHKQSVSLQRLLCSARSWDCSPLRTRRSSSATGHGFPLARCRWISLFR